MFSTFLIHIYNIAFGAFKKGGKVTAQSSSRSALLQSITVGKKLNKVVEVKEVSMFIISCQLP
jgi:hypothetical protein